MCCYPTQENMLEAAVVAIKARLDEQDSNIRQSWLLTEWVGMMSIVTMVQAVSM